MFKALLSVFKRKVETTVNANPFGGMPPANFEQATTVNIPFATNVQVQHPVAHATEQPTTPTNDERIAALEQKVGELEMRLKRRLGDYA